MKAGETRRVQENTVTEKEIIALREENLRLEEKVTQLKT